MPRDKKQNKKINDRRKVNKNKKNKKIKEKIYKYDCYMPGEKG